VATNRFRACRWRRRPVDRWSMGSYAEGAWTRLASMLARAQISWAGLTPSSHEPSPARGDSSGRGRPVWKQQRRFAGTAGGTRT
jgi:hypothetical protein